MLLSSSQTYTHRRCCTMMTICNIKIRYLTKQILKFSDDSIVIQYPDGMRHTIFFQKVINRFVIFHPVFHNLCHFFMRTISEKNRSRIGITHIYMLYSICLFVCTRQFMFFHMIIQIIINRRTAHNSRLRTSIHNLTINIKTWLLILDIHAGLFHLFQICGRFFVNPFIININGW